MRPQINDEITAPEVRVLFIGQSRIVKLAEALEAAFIMNMDLVQTSPDARPPICIFMKKRDWK